MEGKRATGYPCAGEEVWQTVELWHFRKRRRFRSYPIENIRKESVEIKNCGKGDISTPIYDIISRSCGGCGSVEMALIRGNAISTSTVSTLCLPG